MTGYSPLEFVGPLPDYLEQVRLHWSSLELDTSVVEGLQAKVAAGGRTGNHQYVEHLVEATQFNYQNIIAFDLWRPGDRRLIDIVVPTMQVPLWEVPLTTTETAEVYATERQETLVLPTKGGVSIVKARSPIFSISGFPKAPAVEGEPDYPEPPDWRLLINGVPNEFPFSPSVWPLGWQVTHNGKRWTSLVPDNVWEPGVANWREATTSIADWVQPTGSEDAYALGAIVTHNGQTWESTTPNNVWEPGVFGWVAV